MSVAINGTGSITGIDQGFNVTTGSVGIGTDAPAAGNKLHLQDTTACRIQLSTNNTGHTSSDGTRLMIDSSNNFEILNRENANIEFFTNNTERLRINSAGEVYIGSTAASGQGKLFVNDSSGATTTRVHIRNAASTGNAETYYNLDSSKFASVGLEDGSLVFRNSTSSTPTERVRITSDGKFGINTISPGSLLSVSGGTDDDSFIRMNNEEVGLYFGAWGTGSTYPRETTINSTRFDSGSSPFLRVAGQGGIKFCVDLNNERMRIQPSGYVGIGEDAPGGKLTVKHANTATSGLNATLKLKQGVATNGNRSSLIFSSLDDYDVAAVNGVVEVHSGTSSNNVGRLEFWTKASGSNAAERLRISSDGKVCVGTTLTNYGVLQIRDASGDSTTSAIQVENASSGNSTTNVILRSVSLNSGAWANAEYRAKGHVFSHQTSPVLTILPNFGPWAEGNKGTTRGTLHLRPQSTDDMGGAITFGASDRDSGDTAMAGIYTRTDGNYGTKMYFATTDSYAAGPKNAMTINHQGQVTFSSQPCFWATSNTGGSHTNNGYHGIISNQFEAAYVNVGNHYNTSTGVFTCPVAGVYEFHGQGLARQQGGDNNMELTFYKNGANTMSRSYGYTYVKGTNDHDNLHVMGYITCAANDQIDLRTHALGSAVDCYFAQGLGYFAGRLVQ